MKVFQDLYIYIDLCVQTPLSYTSRCAKLSCLSHGFLRSELLASRVERAQINSTLVNDLLMAIGSILFVIFYLRVRSLELGSMLIFSG